MGRFDGKVVAITGAGSGIGHSHALAFAREGARVVVNDLGTDLAGSGTSAMAADAVVGEIEAMGAEAVASYDSAATIEGGKAITQVALDRFGRIDILVNNAGILRDMIILKMPEASWDDVIAVHLKGTFACTRPAARAMRARGEGGRIINTTSITGLLGNFGQANYGSAKAGIAGFTRIAALEFERYGITVNAVAPIAMTRMTEKIAEVADAGDQLDPAFVSPVVLYLASDLAAGITGKIFGVEGGKIFVYETVKNEGLSKDRIWTVEEIHENIGEIMKM